MKPRIIIAIPPVCNVLANLCTCEITILIPLVLYTLKQLFTVVSVNNGRYLPRRLALNLVVLVAFNLSRADEKRSCIVVFFLVFFCVCVCVFNSSFSNKIERRRKCIHSGYFHSFLSWFHSSSNKRFERISLPMRSMIYELV